MPTKIEWTDGAFQAIAEAHPFETYAAYPEQFWMYFHSKNPDTTREKMEERLADYERDFWTWYYETYCEGRSEVTP